MILIDSNEWGGTAVLGFVKRAAIRVASGEFDKAIADYDEAVKQSPSSEYLILRADAHRRKGAEDRQHDDGSGTA
jgi:hypothetical protein